MVKKFADMLAAARAAVPSISVEDAEETSRPPRCGVS